MSLYMLDTNSVSHLIKGHAGLVSRTVAVPMRCLCISCVTQGEILFGLAKRPDATRLHHAVHEFLLRVDVLPWDTTAAQSYGPLRAAMERLGKPLGPLDMMIAAHSLSTGAVLVTNNVRHYERINAPLILENWV